MRHFSYKIDHDFGLAPNPFGPYCTLAVCKSSIRRNKNLEIGSWIFGSGCKKFGLDKLILAMKVSEKITFQEYWTDKRFQYKKPNLNAPLVRIYGDNIYHQDNGDWIQEDSAHSLASGKVNKNHLERDLSGKYVIISKLFYYFGRNAVVVPNKFVKGIFCAGRDMRSPDIDEKSVVELIDWLKQFPKGINGDPINWKQYFPLK